MFEPLMASPGGSRNIISGVTAASTITCGTRSNGACEIVGDEILFMGGQAGNPSPYPGNGFKVNVTNGVNTNISGYDGTWTGGCAIGNNVWIAMGHNGASNNYIRYRAATAFGASGNYVSGKPARHACSIDAYNSNQIFWGLGRGDAGQLSDCYMFNISANTWTTLTPCPVAPSTNTSGRFGSDGKFYCVDAAEGTNLLCYDPVSNTWSRVKSSFPKYFGLSNSALGNSAIRAVGKYLFFTVNHTWNGVANRLSLLRYDVTTSVFVLIPLNIQGRTAPGLVYHTASRRLMIVSGLLNPYSLAYDNAARSTQILTYNIDDLTKPA